MFRRAHSAIAVVALLIVATSCDGPATACSAELNIQISPADTTIQIGQSYTASVLLTTCGGSVTLEDTLTFTSFAPGVASVEERLGVVTGHSAGEAQLDVSGARYGPLNVFSVTVLP